MAAFKEYQEGVWPYKGAIAIKEPCVESQLTQYSVFHQWRYLGVVGCEDLLHDWQAIEQKGMRRSHTNDDYKIASSFLKNKASDDCIIELV